MNIHQLISNLLKNSECLLGLYNNYYRLKNSNTFWEEQKKRKSLSFFDFENVASDMHFCPIEKIKDSNYYGHAYALKQYCGYKNVNAAIEHGLYLGDRVTNAELLKTTKKVIAMSQNRIDSFKKNGCFKPIYAIGPYIHYASPFLTKDEELSIKRQLGKVLLVFPFHSSKHEKASFDHDFLVQKIESIKKDYNTVMVCLHHNDITMNPRYTREYQRLGYTIVSAGHKFDFMFLSRLKSIISLSDFVLSNSIGTHVGYCTYLNKPQIILDDDSSLSALKDSAYNDFSEQIARKQTLEIMNAYGEESLGRITPRQLSVAEKYWGVSKVLTKEGMYKLLIELEQE